VFRVLYNARDRQKGFTLVELLIVIVILGVLAAIVILALGAFDDRGELAACKADVKSVEVAVEAFRADQGNYPASLNELTNPPGNYLREVPNTTEGSGEYWILYEPATGTVEGRLKTNEVCAGGLALATPGPSGPGGGGPGGGGSGTPTPTPTSTTTTPSGGGTTTTTTSPGVAQPPGFPLNIQAENLVSADLRDIIPTCGNWGDFLGNGSGYLSTWQPNNFTIPSGFTGTYRVTVRVDSTQSVPGLRLRYRNGTSGGWTNVTTWNVANGCNQTFTANITFSSAGTKQIQLDNANGWGNRWLLLDAVEIIRIS
jgi:prepilin-type N-terminal cleavage/methylation domain-containing protein